MKPAAVPAPLSQFQHRTFDPSDFRRLLSDLNTHMHVSLTEQQTQMVFERWWPEIKSAYDAIITRSGRGETPVQTRKDRDILEEVLLVVR